MEQVRDLNMEADDMQAVSTSSQVKKYASGCISAPALCRTIGTGGLSPTRSLQERYSIRLRT